MPIVRVCSSGVSQIVKADGEVAASIPFPDQGHSFGERVALVERGRVPFDRPVAWAAMVLTGLFAACLLVMFMRGHELDPSERPREDRRALGLLSVVRPENNR